MRTEASGHRDLKLHLTFHRSLYECELGSTPRLIKSWKVGRAPSGSPSSKIPDFVSLGEIAVDFDFVTPTLKKPEMFANKSRNEVSEIALISSIKLSKKLFLRSLNKLQIKETIGWSQIEWPILVLRGNGEVLIVRGNVLLEKYVDEVFELTLKKKNINSIYMILSYFWN